jgi:hypothetical protein
MTKKKPVKHKKRIVLRGCLTGSTKLAGIARFLLALYIFLNDG